MMAKEPKLYIVRIDNGEEYSDFIEDWKLVVANNEKHAKLLAVEFLLERFSINAISGNVPEYSVEEVTEVDGYSIKLEKIKMNEKLSKIGQGSDSNLIKNLTKNI